MAEINIVARNSGGGGGSTTNTPPPASNQSTAAGGSVVPDAGRLSEEFRKLMQQQGVAFAPGSSNSRQLLQQFSEQQKKEVTSRVSAQFDARRNALDEKYEDRYLNAFDRYNDEKHRILNKHKGKSLDFIESTDEWKSNERYWNDFTTQLDKDKKKEDRLIDSDEKDALTAALRELTVVMRDVKEGAERDDERGDTQNSYLGSLKAQREALIKERDSAATEDEARDASRRLAEVNEKMRKATSSEEEGKPMFDRFMMGSQGVQQLFGGLDSGDLGGAVMGAGSTIAGFGGLGLKAAMRIAGIAALIGGAVKTVQGSAERYDAVSDLAAYRSTSGGLRGIEASQATLGALYESKLYRRGFEDFGMDQEEFAKRAANVVQKRGTGEGWYTETLKQIGLERQFGLRTGALEQGSALDRYGKNVTDAITGLVQLLSNFDIQGANEKDFSRVQEKYDFQQTLMQGYLDRTDKPNYDAANRAVLAMNMVSGITHDQRDVSDYQIMQNAIQNPANDRMKAFLYSTVQSIMPELKNTNGENFTALDAGRMDLIDRAIRNPENETKIMQAMLQGLTAMFGDTGTQIGYYVFKDVFKGIAPDRLDAIVKEFTSTGTVTDSSWALQGNYDQTIKRSSQFGEKWSGLDAASAAQYTHTMTQSIEEIKKAFHNLIDLLLGNADIRNELVNRIATGR